MEKVCCFCDNFITGKFYKLIDNPNGSVYCFECSQENEGDN